jgi:hypothetical protein
LAGSSILPTTDLRNPLEDLRAIAAHVGSHDRRFNVYNRRDRWVRINSSKSYRGRTEVDMHDARVDMRNSLVAQGLCLLSETLEKGRHAQVQCCQGYDDTPTF